MKKLEQDIFIHQGASSSITNGNVAEQEAMELLRSFKSVKAVWKDYNNSKFDIYFILENEDVTRGIQIKSMTKTVKSERNITYYIYDLNTYNNGMLIAAMSKSAGIGLFYIVTDDLKVKSAGVTTKGKNGKFSKFVKQWPEFVKSLENNLRTAPIITQEVFENSISVANLKEYHSINRFLIYCQKFGFDVRRVENGGSNTDLIVNGLKVQMKYRSNPNGNSSYNIDLNKSNGSRRKNDIHKRKPYEKGDNDLYVIELGEKHGEFLVLTENLLIEKGFVKTSSQPGKQTLTVYPYDFLIKPGYMDNNRLQATWTCDIKLWISTNRWNGYFGIPAEI